MGKKGYGIEDGSSLEVVGDNVNLEGRLYCGFPRRARQLSGEVAQPAVCPTTYVVRGDLAYRVDCKSEGSEEVVDRENPVGPLVYVGATTGDDPSFESCSMQYVLARTELGTDALQIGRNAVFAVPSDKEVLSAEQKQIQDANGKNYSVVLVTDLVDQAWVSDK